MPEVNVSKYVDLSPEIRDVLINHFTPIKNGYAGSVENLGRVLPSLEAAATRHERRMIGAGGFRPLIEVVALAVHNYYQEYKSTKEQFDKAQSRFNHYNELVQDVAAGRVDRIEEELESEVKDLMVQMGKKGPGWAPDEDYTHWHHARFDAYQRLFQVANILQGVNPSSATHLKTEAGILAEKYLSPNYD